MPSLKRKPFRLFVIPKARHRPHMTRASVQVMTSTPVERVLANTPTLRALYDFLRDSKLRVP